MNEFREQNPYEMPVVMAELVNPEPRQYRTPPTWSIAPFVGLAYNVVVAAIFLFSTFDTWEDRQLGLGFHVFCGSLALWFCCVQPELRPARHLGLRHQ